MIFPLPINWKQIKQSHETFIIFHFIHNWKNYFYSDFRFDHNGSYSGCFVFIAVKNSGDFISAVKAGNCILWNILICWGLHYQPWFLPGGEVLNHLLSQVTQTQKTKWTEGFNSWLHKMLYQPSHTKDMDFDRSFLTEAYKALTLLAKLFISRPTGKSEIQQLTTIIKYISCQLPSFRYSSFIILASFSS